MQISLMRGLDNVIRDLDYMMEKNAPMIGQFEISEKSYEEVDKLFEEMELPYHK